VPRGRGWDCGRYEKRLLTQGCKNGHRVEDFFAYCLLVKQPPVQRPRRSGRCGCPSEDDNEVYDASGSSLKHDDNHLPNEMAQVPLLPTRRRYLPREPWTRNEYDIGKSHANIYMKRTVPPKNQKQHNSMNERGRTESRLFYRYCSITLSALCAYEEALTAGDAFKMLTFHGCMY
jgi:hypothetical protein